MTDLTQVSWSTRSGRVRPRKNRVGGLQSSREGRVGKSSFSLLLPFQGHCPLPGFYWNLRVSFDGPWVDGSLGWPSGGEWREPKTSNFIGLGHTGVKWHGEPLLGIPQKFRSRLEEPRPRSIFNKYVWDRGGPDDVFTQDSRKDDSGVDVRRGERPSPV